jgi:hypothetical protein
MPIAMMPMIETCLRTSVRLPVSRKMLAPVLVHGREQRSGRYDEGHGIAHG